MPWERSATLSLLLAVLTFRTEDAVTLAASPVQPKSCLDGTGAVNRVVGLGVVGSAQP